MTSAAPPPAPSAPHPVFAAEGPGDVLLDVEDVCLKLGESQILEKVSFQVKDRVRPGLVTGQVVGLLGPSGVGKTRLIRLIAGLDRPDSGSITGIHKQPLKAGAVGVVFQDYPLLRHHTVLGNMVVAGIANGLTKSESQTKARALLERFGLGERLGFFPAQLSGGQRQRVAIAQQMMRQKQLLLMDEPFSGLDPVTLAEVSKLLVEVANMDELNTVVVVTHDVRSALAVSDTVFMLGRNRPDGAKAAGGACIQHCYDLVVEGLAWRPGVEADPRFREVEHEVRDRFRVL
ncbi:MAG TPA: ATP-binding cassette domain-containing protein [Polyangia bacterium]|nr:ATP-binding cassette domain-containing protein [Polyangia bacterium]